MPDETINLNLLEEENLYHWEIEFEIKVDKVNLDSTDPEIKQIADATTESYIWVSDTLVVRASDDAQLAVNKAKLHVMGVNYELPCLEFKLKAVKLSSAADI